jgi:predicted ATP-dependent endonuclease of OLD family
MDNVKELTKNTRRDTLFLYWANGGNNKLAMTVCRWFESIYIYDAEDTKRLLNATIEYLEESKEAKNNVLNLLRKADINILDFDIDKSQENEQNTLLNKTLRKDYVEKTPPSKTMPLLTRHSYYNNKWDVIGILSTPMFVESAGTRKLLEIAGPIIVALEQGSVVFIDEVDTHLHPTLVRFLVMMFNSIINNPNNAQLICNTHDVLLLEGDIRRDQVYFIEKDERGVSKLYALTDFKGVRKDSKLLKRYLLGAFGAVPKLQEFYVPSKG